MRTYFSYLLLCVFYAIAVHAADMSQPGSVTITHTERRSCTFSCYSSCFSRCLARMCRRWTTPVATIVPTDSSRSVATASDNKQEDDGEQLQVLPPQLRKQSGNDRRMVSASSTTPTRVASPGTPLFSPAHGTQALSGSAARLSPVPPLDLGRIQLFPHKLLPSAPPNTAPARVLSTLHNSVPGELA
ncbi:MAG: hypothetical protein ACHQVS_04275 [Candidatus Babeliales bacterium]